MAFMPGSDLYQASMLQNVGVLYDDPNAVWKTVCPIIPAELSGEYPIFDADFVAFRDERASHKMGSADRPRKVSFGHSTAAYTLQPYYLMDEVGESEIEQGKRMNLDVLADHLTGLLTLHNTDMNNDLADLLTDTGVFTQTHTPTVKWDVVTSGSPIGDPEKDVNIACEAIEVASGGARQANTMIMGRHAANIMFRNPNVRDVVKYTLSDKAQMLSAINNLFGIQRVLVVGAGKNTADKGQSDSMSSIWSTKVWVGYIEQNPGRMKPSAIYGLAYQGIGPANPFGIRSWEESHMGQDSFQDGFRGSKVFSQVYTNFKVTAANLGYIIDATYTP